MVLYSHKNEERIKSYLFIAYEMYIKEKSKEYLDNELDGVSLLMEMTDFEEWAKSEHLI